ncbi:hypothetical protein [Mycoplasmopsis iners]|uniref:hypothetical protein n=1 Tax=Mycoplasmopsis iners TaxID=76630 RepID=UPI000496DAC4|nr:hypothetical protein [Mycoplasmopsis iners]
MKKSRKIFLSFGGIIASSLVLVSAITVANQENWNEFQKTAAEELKTFIESQKKAIQAVEPKLNNELTHCICQISTKIMMVEVLNIKK